MLCAMTDHLNALGLHERNKRPIGTLVQLSDAELLASVDGMCVLRVLGVDFLTLLHCTVLICDGIITLLEQANASIMDTAGGAIRFIYGWRVDFDFRNLVVVLMRTGSSLVEAIRGILSNKYGSYFEWRQKAVALETELSKGGLHRDDLWSRK